MKWRLLVVDDHVSSAKDIRAILVRNLDCEVELAFDGGEAISKATEGRPDLILLDVELPALDGFEVLARIKAEGIATRVIMFSGYRIDVATAVRAIKQGACDYLTKPVSAFEVIEHVKRAMLTDSTINLHFASEATPLMQRLLQTLEKLPNQDDKSTSKKDLDDYYVPSSSLKDRFAKH
ncbi:MAG: hypothetical protein DME97_03105 [Verrucomicrobia bacterium]|nr:MAG: hypothetical protein DME97_03105 [Verrucomicrobiota bacterium]